MRAAVGLVVHTGHAAGIVLAGAADAPEVIARVTVDMADDPERFVFHRVAEGQRAEAEAAVAGARSAAIERAGRALDELLARLCAEGHPLAVCAVVAKATAPRASLDAILASHPRIHAAEAIFFRDVLVDAATARGLATSVIALRDLLPRAARAIGIPVDGVPNLLAALGKRAGRPWTRDQKDSALAAWTAL